MLILVDWKHRQPQGWRISFIGIGSLSVLVGLFAVAALLEREPTSLCIAETWRKNPHVSCQACTMTEPERENSGKGAKASRLLANCHQLLLCGELFFPSAVGSHRNVVL